MFRHGSSQATISQITLCGVFEAAYSGEICAEARDKLRQESLIASAAAKVFVVRLDGAQFSGAENYSMEAKTFSENAAPGVLIVRPDQFEVFSAYAKTASKVGVMRSVWLVAHATKAYE